MLAISLGIIGTMSYLADIIKNQIRQKLQFESELSRANQILETVPDKLESTDVEIQKAVQAAEILGESENVAQQLYNTYPDIDVTTLGLPEPQEKPLTDVDDETVTYDTGEVTTTEIVRIAPEAREVEIYDETD